MADTYLVTDVRDQSSLACITSVIFAFFRSAKARVRQAWRARNARWGRVWCSLLDSRLPSLAENIQLYLKENDLHHLNSQNLHVSRHSCIAFVWFQALQYVLSGSPSPIFSTIHEQSRSSLQATNRNQIQILWNQKIQYSFQYKITKLDWSVSFRKKWVTFKQCPSEYSLTNTVN